jgi:glycosyltransferase involved in cell wall biosynthesis
VGPRVLFLDHTGALGGAELSLLDVACHFAGSSTVLLFADGPFRARLREAGVRAAVIAAPATVSGASRDHAGLSDLRAVPGLLRLARQLARLSARFDLIYANSQKAALIGALAGRLAGRPVLWHLRDMLTAEHFSRSRRWLAVTVANLAVARVIANSRATAAAFVAAGGHASRVRVVYNGIDPAPFDRCSPQAVESLRRQLGVTDGPVVGAFSRLAPWKGQHILLDALARLPDVQALMVGDALFGEHDYACALRRQAAALGIAERVRFLGFRDDIPAVMQLVDVVVHTSVAPEPFGRILVEGMLAHRPVIATRAGGAQEIIDDGVTGVLVPPGDRTALTAALAGLLTDPGRARTLAKAGHAAAVQQFSREAMLRGVEQQVREVVSMHASRQR